MGVSLEDVIRLSTINPAKEINRSELGTLSIGSAGDIAVIELLEGNFSYNDTSAGKMKGDKKQNDTKYGTTINRNNCYR